MSFISSTKKLSNADFGSCDLLFFVTGDFAVVDIISMIKVLIIFLEMGTKFFCCASTNKVVAAKTSSAHAFLKEPTILPVLIFLSSPALFPISVIRVHQW